MTRRCSIVVMLAALAGCGVYGLKTRPPSSDQATAELAPAFVLPDADGNLVSLDDLLGAGRPAVLIFYRGHW